VIDANLPAFLNRSPRFCHKNFDIGDFTYGKPTLLAWKKDIDCCLKIGKFCSIADGVEIYLGGEHNSDWVSTYPFTAMFGSNLNGTQKSKGDIVIGNDVWIGRGVTILSGVTIGDGAAIGARSVVAKDVLPYSVMVGNPAQRIKFRFTHNQIVQLLKIKWWDWEYEKIEEYIPLLESGDIDKFIEGAKNARS